MKNPYKLARRAADELREKTGVDRYDVAIVLGSGWKEGAVALGSPESDVVSTTLSGLPKATAPSFQPEPRTIATS